jgi:uncharacterized Rmd1/YagE family protein
MSDDSTNINIRDITTARATLLGSRLNLKDIARFGKLAEYPLVIEAGQHGFAALFRYGAVITFGLNAVEQASFFENLKPFIVDPYDTIEDDVVDIHVVEGKDDAVTPEFIRIKHADIQRLQVIADILAKNVVLSHYERQIGETFDKIEPIAQRMQKTGAPSGRQARDLLRQIGSTLSVQRTIVGQVEIHDKPDLVWDRPDLERFFSRLEDDYEIKERHSALKTKLELIFHTADTMLGVLQNQKSHRVEWYITILIVVEILMTLAEKYLGF